MRKKMPSSSPSLLARLQLVLVRCCRLPSRRALAFVVIAALLLSAYILHSVTVSTVFEPTERQRAEIVLSVTAALRSDLEDVAESVVQFAGLLPKGAGSDAKDATSPCMDGPFCSNGAGYKAPLLLWNRIFYLAADVAPLFTEDYTTALPSFVREAGQPAMNWYRAKLAYGSGMREFLEHFWYLAKGGHPNKYKPLHPELCGGCLARKVLRKTAMTNTAHLSASQRKRFMRAAFGRDDLLVTAGSRNSRPRRSRNASLDAEEDEDSSYLQHPLVVFVPSNMLSTFVTAAMGVEDIVHSASMSDEERRLAAEKVDALFKRKIVLVSGWTDPGPSFFAASSSGTWSPERFMNRNFVHSWWAQNCDVDHVKMRCLPIGIDWHTVARRAAWGLPQLSAQAQARQLAKVVRESTPHLETDTRANQVVLDFALGSNTYNRTKLFMSLGYKSWAKTIWGHTARLDTWRNYARYRFVLSAPGNGYECHRTYEALAMGAVPILQHHPNPAMRSRIFDDIYHDMPVAMVDDFATEITPEKLDEWWKDVGLKYADAERHGGIGGDGADPAAAGGDDGQDMISSSSLKASWRRRLTNWFWFEKLRTLSS